MIAFTMIMNHLAGIILLMICIGNGMLDIGKIKPDRMITGSINPKSEIIIAVCCELAIVEIKIQKRTEKVRNRFFAEFTSTEMMHFLIK